LFNVKESFQASTYNEKLQELQNQMSKLKDNLSRYSGKENNSKFLNTRNNKLKQRISINSLSLHQSNLKTPPRINEEESFENNKEEEAETNSKAFSKKYSHTKTILEDITARNLMKENDLNDSYDTKPAESQSKVSIKCY